MKKTLLFIVWLLFVLKAVSASTITHMPPQVMAYGTEPVEFSFNIVNSSDFPRELELTTVSPVSVSYYMDKDKGVLPSSIPPNAEITVYGLIRPMSDLYGSEQVIEVRVKLGNEESTAKTLVVFKGVEDNTEETEKDNTEEGRETAGFFSLAGITLGKDFWLNIALGVVAIGLLLAFIARLVSVKTS